MSNDTAKTSSGGIGFLSLLVIVFITLKLLGYITWSWWWVTAPLWMPISIVLAIMLVVLMFAGVHKAFWDKGIR